jgi:hypothetical protein
MRWAGETRPLRENQRWAACWGHIRSSSPLERVNLSAVSVRDDSAGARGYIREVREILTVGATARIISA